MHAKSSGKPEQPAQLKRACRPCSASKVKCDKGRPCSRCIERNKTDECVDVLTKAEKRRRQLLDTISNSALLGQYLPESSHSEYSLSEWVLESRGIHAASTEVQTSNTRVAEPQSTSIHSTPPFFPPELEGPLSNAKAMNASQPWTSSENTSLPSEPSLFSSAESSTTVKSEGAGGIPIPLRPEIPSSFPYCGNYFETSKGRLAKGNVAQGDTRTRGMTGKRQPSPTLYTEGPPLKQERFSSLSIPPVADTGDTRPLTTENRSESHGDLRFPSVNPTDWKQQKKPQGPTDSASDIPAHSETQISVSEVPASHAMVSQHDSSHFDEFSSFRPRFPSHEEKLSPLDALFEGFSDIDHPPFFQSFDGETGTLFPSERRHSSASNGFPTPRERLDSGNSEEHEGLPEW
eukprot:gb/GECG01001346.1/.p1 GENE.gb/GECG01001346.1/~~gb/GECG01001346.1/.p1  ORF type:complete len:404 (+),score=47.39 gb/GECG01001346.1/:1-1212(+)